MAPVDIIINIVEGKKKEALEACLKAAKEDREIMEVSYQEGKYTALQELIDELEGFKKLFE